MEGDVGDAFVHALLRDEEQSVRLAVRRGIDQLCAVSADARPFFVSLLLSSIDEVYSYAHQSTSYFALLSNLLLTASAEPAVGVNAAVRDRSAAEAADSAVAQMERAEVFSLEVTARDLAARIQRRRIVEHSASDDDVVLQGLLCCAATLLARADAGVARAIDPVPASASVGVGAEGGDATLNTLLHHIFHDCLFAGEFILFTVTCCAIRLTN